jgi:hypothetical protein
MRGEANAFIEAPPGQVWGLLADVTRMADWSPECIRCQWLDGATGPSVGVRFRGWNRLPFVGTWTSVSTIVRCVAGAELSWAVGRDPADPNTCWEYLLTPCGSGTNVVERYEMRREPPIVRLYYRLVGRPRRLERAMDETLRRLKEAAEEPGGR